VRSCAIYRAIKALHKPIQREVSKRASQAPLSAATHFSMYKLSQETLRETVHIKSV